MKCPRCSGDEVRLFVVLNPGIVLECLGYDEVWKEESKYV